jgi:hypothetical protein
MMGSSMNGNKTRFSRPPEQVFAPARVLYAAAEFHFLLLLTKL